MKNWQKLPTSGVGRSSRCGIDQAGQMDSLPKIDAIVVFFQKSLFAGLIICSMCLADLDSGNAAETGRIQGITKAHNRVRGQLGIPPLSWSDELAETARRWAEQLAADNNCRMRHRRSGDYGENIYWASAVQWSQGTRDVQVIDAQHVVDSWAQEAADYDHQKKRCRKGSKCGHYTQIIWRESKELGCGMAICADKGQIWVCNYSPPGNVIGESPY